MKKVFLTFIALGCFALGWYLFAKKGDLVVFFKANSSTGNLYNEVMHWHFNNELIKPVALQEIEEYNELEEELEYQGASLKINWEFTYENDSVTLVKARITEPSRSLINRLTIPFNDTEIEENGYKIVYNFKTFLEENLSMIKVTLEGTKDSPSGYCACIHSSSTPQRKAFEMMKNYNYVSDFLVDNGMTLEGKPMVQVTHYDKVLNKIEFDFCFPVKRKDSLPEHPEIFFKTIASQPSIKAVFNGNYIRSNKAWYSIYDYAKARGFALQDKPLEVFYNNPNFGGNELNWKTEIYMPLVE
ncbi:GyrI-like domain-containing protein [Robertkochia solimangrovi]|uniref:GyrI-like domain-containing protein n=1 Tax=Robertkochia solimangrovi TaxID=2213046 RepID=UPI00117ED761|nr:GyrI-like domain-containing protein [Robertkochia solimangrovi]TRZ43311.1 hypothetical protein DMZ48_11560 [Robertkochia solimangrovi]